MQTNALRSPRLTIPQPSIWKQEVKKFSKAAQLLCILQWMSTKIIYLVQGLCSKGSSMVVQASPAFLVKAPPSLIIQAPPLWMISPVLLLLMNQALPPSGHLSPPSRSNSVSWQHLLQCACGLLLLDVIVQFRCSMHNTQQCNSLTVLGVDVVAAGDWRRTAWFAPFVAFACQPLAICLRTLLSLYSQPGDCWVEMLVGVFWCVGPREVLQDISDRSSSLAQRG